MPPTPQTALAWYDPLTWPATLRDCTGCPKLLSLLLDGWRVPSEDRRPTARLHGQAERRARDKRIRFLGNRLERSFRTLRYWVRGRPLLVSDGPETWRKAGIAAGVPERDMERIIEDVFTEADRKWDERGDPLHRHITPGVVAGVKERVEDALDHLYDLPADALEDHFEQVFGATRPPGLGEVCEVLVDRWSRGYRRRGTALRVAAMLPLRSLMGARVPVPLTLDQIRDLYYKRDR